MEKRMALLLAVIALPVLSAPAFSALNEGNGNGNPTTTPSGTCPAGQNKDTSNGGLKKC
jgi:hypothetical protein